MRPMVVASIEEMRSEVREAKRAGHRVGLVPTMGALHAGHEALVVEARRDCSVVVVSIFVNPTQFGPGEDYHRYPRTWERDLEASARAGATHVFAPAVDAMYPGGTGLTSVRVAGLSDRFEGASRPGHFDGVATVVAKLFLIAEPDRAYFGQKDYQQQLIIRTMIRDLDIPVELVTVPTVRADDGLALSSRNRYLSHEERGAALVLSRALDAAEEAVRGGERGGDRVRQILWSTLQSEPMVEPDYAELVDASTLDPIETLAPGRPGVVLLAARVGPARLIDNRVLSV